MYTELNLDLVLGAKLSIYHQYTEFYGPIVFGAPDPERIVAENYTKNIVD